MLLLLVYSIIGSVYSIGIENKVFKKDIVYLSTESTQNWKYSYRKVGEAVYTNIRGHEFQNLS